MRRLVAVLLAVLCLGACDNEVYFDDVVPYPAGCPRLVIEPDACAALVGEAAARLELSTTAIARTDLLSQDRCGDDRRTLCRRTLPLAGTVRFTLTDGSFRWIAVTCPLGDAPPPAWCRP